MADLNKVFEKTDAAEKAYGLPPGIMRAIMHNEIRYSDKYLDTPDTYHYPVAADGKHRTKEGTQSSAFGPFGILDSTAQKPGYGITPLKDKSLDEQVRFTAEMLAKTSKHLGGIDKALDLYGGGTPGYTQKVLQNIANPERIAVKNTTPVMASNDVAPAKVVPLASAPKVVPVQPTVVQAAPVEKPVVIAEAPKVVEPSVEQPVIAQAESILPVAEPVTPEALQYGQQPAQVVAKETPKTMLDVLASLGEDAPQAQEANVKALSQAKNVALQRAVAKVANLGAGLETNDQVAQLQQDARPMETFKNIVMQQRAEAENYG
jgi:hypothetical protein